LTDHTCRRPPSKSYDVSGYQRIYQSWHQQSRWIAPALIPTIRPFLTSSSPRSLHRLRGCQIIQVRSHSCRYHPTSHSNLRYCIRASNIACTRPQYAGPVVCCPIPSGKAPSAAPLSAPVPMLSAALLGAASEKSKSLEVAAQLLAKQVVERAMWNDAWHANAVDGWAEHCFAIEAWQADVRCVTKAFGTLPRL